MTKSNDNQKSLVRYLLIIPVMLMLIFVLSIKDNLLNARPTGMSDELGGLYQEDGELYQYNKQSSQFIHKDTVPVLLYSRSTSTRSGSGGDSILLVYIRSNLNYPEDAKKAGVEGIVVVQFIIDKSGQVKDPQVARGVHESLDAEAIRLVREMPNWKPGYQGGVLEDTKFFLPIRFRLSSEEEEDKKQE